MENENSNKLLHFNGTAGGAFVATLVYVVLFYIPIVGWAFGINYYLNWAVENFTIKGKNLKYTATFGDMFVFGLLNFLLILVTLGIYTFWFIPKAYNFVADHVEEV